MSHNGLTPLQVALYRDRLATGNQTLKSTISLPAHAFLIDRSGSISDADLEEAIRDFEEIIRGEQ